jgi:hypothetical protein
LHAVSYLLFEIIPEFSHEFSDTDAQREWKVRRGAREKGKGGREGRRDGGGGREGRGRGGGGK